MRGGGEWFLRFVILDRLSHKLIHLNYWSEFPRSALAVGLEPMALSAGIGWFSHTDLSDCAYPGHSLPYHYFSLPKSHDNRFGLVSPNRHLLSSGLRIIGVDHFLRGASQASALVASWQMT